MRILLSDLPWILAFGLIPVVFGQLRKFFWHRSEAPFSIEGMFDYRVHIHFAYPIASGGGDWELSERRELCFSSIYFEDGRECMVRGICDLGVEKGDAVRISKDRDGVYSVVLKDRSASRKRGGFS
ncbi:MAG: hypothetical protein LiPW15_513 [Parcubacteria group bacterium LiPW_15]|nr:MAG: hypothetical protein LiPW15_513 [Parcubacteria group bacterium LiPW_15]